MAEARHAICPWDTRTSGPQMRGLYCNLERGASIMEVFSWKKEKKNSPSSFCFQVISYLTVPFYCISISVTIFFFILGFNKIA